MYFYPTLNCAECDNEIYWGPCVTLIETDDGLPVIPLDIGAQQITCPDCGTNNYTGDVEILTEDDLT